MRLSKRFFRIALSLLAAALVCVMSRSALADAPQCDVRAATTYAPNPKLDSPTGASIDAPSDCANDGRLFGRVIQRGHAPSAPDSVDSLPRAAVPAALRVRPASPTAALARRAESFSLPAGIRDRVDRPPRG